jgi:hypothetical protein
MELLFNVHVNNNGAGIRLYFGASISLAHWIVALLPPSVPTTFSTGLGVELVIANVNGGLKVGSHSFLHPSHTSQTTHNPSHTSQQCRLHLHAITRSSP